MLHRNTIYISTLLTLILAFATYYFGLFIDLTGDAGKYAAISRYIIESGDFINLKIHGEPYDQKPPLLFWLAALGFKVCGLNNFSYKIFPVLYAFLGVFFTLKLGKSLYNKRTGIIAACFLSFSQFYFIYCTDVHTDLLLQANIALSMWQLSEYFKTGKHVNFIFAFIGVGLAMLSKGPIGAAVPAFGIGAYLIMKKDFGQIFHLKWLAGIFISALIISPALFGLYNQFGYEGFKFFFWTNNAGRITGEYRGNNGDYLYYIHTMLYMYAPWSLLLPASVFAEIKSIIRRPFKQPGYLITGAIIVYFLIISVAKAKSPHYIFILVPLFSVLNAKWVDYFLHCQPGRMFMMLKKLQTISLITASLFFLITATYLFPSQDLKYWLTALVFSILSYLLYTLTDFQAAKLLLPSMLIITLINFYLNTHALPYISEFQASTQATRLFNEKSKENDILYNYMYDQYELFFYGKNSAIQIKDKKQLADVLEKEHSWIYTDQTGYESIKRFNYPIDTVYTFKNKGMNQITLKFILPYTRERSINTMYLIKSE